MCSSKKYPYPLLTFHWVTQWKVNGNLEGMGGYQKPKFSNESMGFNWNFQRGGGLKPIILLGRGIDFFWNTTIKKTHDEKCDFY